MSSDVRIAAPDRHDGKAMWRIARDSKALDLNSSYAYVLWCSEFSATSAIAKIDGEAIGFVTGFRPPAEPHTLMVWQIAVDENYRGLGIAQALLDAIINRQPAPSVRWLKTTIAPSNRSSIGLFEAFTDRHHTILSRTSMFTTADFPDRHEPEDLYIVGPLAD